MRHMAGNQSGGNATGFSGGMGDGERPLQIWCQRDEASGKILRKSEITAERGLEYEYLYDAEGRLFRVFRNSLMTEQYTHTAAGQRLVRSNGWADGQTKYYYDPSGSLLAAVSGSRMLRFAYDGAGNLVRREEIHFPQNEGEERVTVYTYEGTRLRAVTLPDGTVISYLYDPGSKNPLGPVAKFCGDTLVMEYAWKDLTKLLACCDYQAGLCYEFAYRGDGLARVLLRGKQGELDLAVGCDQVNTPKVFIDRYGREVKFIEYDSFGNVESDSLPGLFIPIGFAGGLFDRDTGLVRFGFRDYDPFAGRFTCPDPAKDMRGDGDLYDYCVDDPVNMHDPNGLWTKETFAESKVKRGDDGKFSGSGGSREQELCKTFGPYRGDTQAFHSANPVIFSHESNAPHPLLHGVSGSLTSEKGIGGTLLSRSHEHGKTKLVVYGDPNTRDPSSWVLLEWVGTGKKNPETNTERYEWKRVPNVKAALAKHGVDAALFSFWRFRHYGK